MSLPTPDPDLDIGHDEIERGAAEQASGTPLTETEREVSERQDPGGTDEDTGPTG